MKQVTIDIQFWLDFFQNRRTQKIFQHLAKITVKTGHETSFGVEINSQGAFVFDDPCEGGCASIGPDARKIKHLDEHDDYVSTVDLLFFHFHPEDRGAIGPSVPDLKLFKTSPFIAIGQVLASGEILILMIKECAPLKDPETRELLEEALDQSENQAEIFQLLSELGYHAVLIPLGNVRSNQWNISQATVQQLHNFSMTFTIPSDEEFWAAAEEEMQERDLQ